MVQISASAACCSKFSKACSTRFVLKTLPQEDLLHSVVFEIEKTVLLPDDTTQKWLLLVKLNHLTHISAKPVRFQGVLMHGNSQNQSVQLLQLLHYVDWEHIV